MSCWIFWVYAVVMTEALLLGFAMFLEWPHRRDVIQVWKSLNVSVGAVAAFVGAIMFGVYLWGVCCQ